MAERDAAVSRAVGASFEQGIFHARHLLLHGFERLTNDPGSYSPCAQVANFLNLQEIEKGIALSRGHQSGFFPVRQLTRREPKNSLQIRSTVSVHACLGAFSAYYQEVNPQRQE